MGQRYVSAWDNGLRALGAEWIKEGSRSKDDTLNSLMQIDHVIRVNEDGTVSDAEPGVYAPEINMDTDDSGQILAEHKAALIDDMKRQGWEVQTGWSGQYLTKGNDPGMHDSEFIGGPLAEHLLSTPGHWVACSVEVDSEECPNDSPTCKLSEECAICRDGTGKTRERDAAGWVIMHKGVPDNGNKK